MQKDGTFQWSDDEISKIIAQATATSGKANGATSSASSERSVQASSSSSLNDGLGLSQENDSSSSGLVSSVSSQSTEVASSNSENVANDINYQDIIDKVRTYAESITDVKFIWSPHLAISGAPAIGGLTDLNINGTSAVIQNLKLQIAMTESMCLSNKTSDVKFTVVCNYYQRHYVYAAVFK